MLYENNLEKVISFFFVSVMPHNNMWLKLTKKNEEKATL